LDPELPTDRGLPVRGHGLPAGSRLRLVRGAQKLVDRGGRWTLAEIVAEVGVSPVYLTQVFQQVEGLPLYRYQLRLRLRLRFGGALTKEAPGAFLKYICNIQPGYAG
jgi:AraC-like DNA-binding protein